MIREIQSAVSVREAQQAPATVRLAVAPAPMAPEQTSPSGAVATDTAGLSSFGTSASLAALREAALQPQPSREEMILKGSAFLLDPNYPPMNKVNAVSSILFNDFFSSKIPDGI